MVKLQRPITRILAVLMLLIMLIGILPVNSYAAGTKTIYLETLINEDGLNYVTNPIQDTYAKNKKYEYMYTQIGTYIAKACGDGTTAGIEGSRSNANYCYGLNDKLNFSGGEETDSDKWIKDSANATAADFFVGSEGFFKFDGSSLTKTSDKSETYPLVGDKFGESKSNFYSENKRYLDAGLFQFPSNITGKDATTKENDYAVNSASILTSSLNQALSLTNDGKRFADVAELINKSISIRPISRTKNIGVMAPSKDSKKNGYAIVYAPNDENSIGAADAASLSAAKDAILKGSEVIFSDANSFFDKTKLPKADKDGNLLMYIFKMENNPESTYGNSTVFCLNTNNSACSSGVHLDTSSMSTIVYAIPKGYSATPGGKIVFPDAEGKEQAIGSKDITYLTIHMLAQNANNMYKQYGLSISTIDHSNDVNMIEKVLVDFFNGLINGILTFLGLTPTTELVYNGGIRGSSTFNYGLMSEGWWQVVVRYHIIFQAIAWFIIIVGFLKTLISLNMSTINPRIRENVYESIKKFLVVGFGLILIIPITQFMLAMNSSIVGIFASQVNLDVIGGYVPGGFAGIIVILMYATIQVYVNFIYIMRSIITALLIISGPFFVATIAMSKDGKSTLFVSWSKELIANVFIQSVHAFSLAFLWSLMQSGTGLENIVISFSIIPITEMFRALIFGGAGAATEALGKQAALKAQQMGLGAIQGFGGAVAGGVAGGLTHGTTSAEDAEKEAAGAGGGVGGGAGGRPNPGASALNSASKQKIDSLRESSKKAGKEGRIGAMIGDKAGQIAWGAARGAGKGLTTMGSALAGTMTAELSGNPMAYGAVGQTLGSAAGGAVVGVGSSIQGMSDRSHNQTGYANEQGVSNEELRDLYGAEGVTDEKLGATEQSIPREAIDRAAAGQGSSADIAQHLKRAAAGDHKAKQYLKTLGITGVRNDGSQIAFNKGIGYVQGRSVSRNGSTYVTKIASPGMVAPGAGSSKAHPVADETLTREQFQQKIATDGQFARKAKATGMMDAFNGGPSQGTMADGTWQLQGGNLVMSHEGAVATADGHGYMVKGGQVFNPNSLKPNQMSASEIIDSQASPTTLESDSGTAQEQ